MSSTPDHNAVSYWCDEMRAEFVTEIKWLDSAVRERVLPAFNNIEGEAEEAAENAWQDVLNRPSDGNEDLGDYAEYAIDVGNEHYNRLSDVRQNMVNMIAVALWHLIEQQIVSCVESYCFDIHRAPLDSTPALDHLKTMGVNPRRLPTYSKINELRHVANTVKHGKGPSRKKLAKMRSKLLKHPCLQEDLAIFDQKKFRKRSGPKLNSSKSPDGDRVYATDSDLAKYAEEAIRFWEEVFAEVKLVNGKG